MPDQATYISTNTDSNDIDEVTSEYTSNKTTMAVIPMIITNTGNGNVHTLSFGLCAAAPQLLKEKPSAVTGLLPHDGMHPSCHF